MLAWRRHGENAGDIFVHGPDLISGLVWEKAIARHSNTLKDNSLYESNYRVIVRLKGEIF